MAKGDSVAGAEERGGVSLANLDEQLSDGTSATKRDLVDLPGGVG